jgi:hypothetical protein
MKKIQYIFITLTISLFLTGYAFAESCRLKYRFTPGQKWLCTMSNQSEGSISKKKKKNRSKTIIEYHIKKSNKKGWVILEGKILSTGRKRSRIDLSKITYAADVHKSGEIRNIRYSGDYMPDFGDKASQIPEATMKMMRQSFKMLPEFWKHSVYWFPEVPEHKLEIGDEFEYKRKMGIKTGTSSMQVKSVNKQIFILEDISEGLAWFTVKEKSVTKGTAAMGSNTKTKSAGKGDAVFDLELGMWAEFTEKTKLNMDMGALTGAARKNVKARTVIKYEMEPQ